MKFAVHVKKQTVASLDSVNRRGKKISLMTQLVSNISTKTNATKWQAGKGAVQVFNAVTTECIHTGNK